MGRRLASRFSENQFSYESGPAAGGPAITRNDYETGVAWYLSTRLDVEDLTTLITGILAERSIEIATMKPGLEVVTRVGADARYTFLINHSETESTFPLTGSDLLTGEFFDREIAVPPGTVRVIRHNR